MLIFRDVFSPLLHQTRGIVFYSTPHRGTPVLKSNAGLLKTVFGFTPLVMELKYDSPKLLELNQEFLKLNPLPDILCLGEHLTMRLGKYENVVVPPSSSQIEVLILKLLLLLLFIAWRFQVDGRNRS